MRKRVVRMMDYNNYPLSKREWLIEGVKSIGESVFLGILFFRSVYGCILLLPYGIWRLIKKGEYLRSKQKSILRLQFKDLVLSIAASLQAGYVLEQTIFVAYQDLERMGYTKESPVLKELSWMKKQITLGESVENLFCDLGVRSGITEIVNYAEILTIGKRQGGNLVKISKNAADHISKSIQTESEIEQILAGKILEKDIMQVMPYIILVYLQLTNNEYMDVLYTNWIGRVIMFAGFLGTAFARIWAERILCISV